MPDIERIHPQSMETLRQLVELHGARRLVASLADVCASLSTAEKAARPKDATAGFAHSANSVLLRQIAPRLYE